MLKSLKKLWLLALIVCKNRMFIIPDKTDNWEYVWLKDEPVSSVRYLYHDIEKSGNYESLLISYGLTADASTALSIQQKIKSLTGHAPLIMLRVSTSNCVKQYNQLKENAPAGSFMMQFGGTYNQNSNYETLTNAYNGPVAAWTIDDPVDTPTTWAEMMDRGIRFILTNHPMDMVRFAARLHAQQ